MAIKIQRYTYTGWFGYRLPHQRFFIVALFSIAICVNVILDTSHSGYGFLCAYGLLLMLGFLERGAVAELTAERLSIQPRWPAWNGTVQIEPEQVQAITIYTGDGLSIEYASDRHLFSQRLVLVPKHWRDEHGQTGFTDALLAWLQVQRPDLAVCDARTTQPLRPAAKTVLALMGLLYVGFVVSLTAAHEYEILAWGGYVWVLLLTFVLAHIGVGQVVAGLDAPRERRWGRGLLAIGVTLCMTQALFKLDVLFTQHLSKNFEYRITEGVDEWHSAEGYVVRCGGTHKTMLPKTQNVQVERNAIGLIRINRLQLCDSVQR